jgi:hypothetical protein
MDETDSTRDALHPLELHYFRVPCERWELMLTRVRQMGADAVGSVVPWSWHEPAEGVFDMAGLTHPARDLPAFLRACRTMGLQVRLQVAPRPGTGLLHGGLPGWLPAKYPEICALGPDEQPRLDACLGGCLPSPEHPTYLKHVERWYRELAGVLAGWQAPDGPIAALRIGHGDAGPAQAAGGEIPRHWDFNPSVVNIQWPVWLRQQYDGIDALNVAWGAQHRSFNEAAFPRQMRGAETSPQRLEDAARFVAYSTAHARESYTRMLREAGWGGEILAEPGEAPESLEVSHAVQVDPEPPQVSAGLRWAMDAPLRGDGSPRRRFWQVKAARLGVPRGVKRWKGGAWVTGPESRRVRLPRPEGKYAVYRLLLDGRLIGARGRVRDGALYVDYAAVDEAGETDVYLVLDRPGAALDDFAGGYLAFRLAARRASLEQGAQVCRTLAEALAGQPHAAQTGAAPRPAEGLQAAERGVTEAWQAAGRAAAALGRLERLAGEIRGTHPPVTAAMLPGAGTFTPAELGRLGQVRDACEQASLVLEEAARSMEEDGRANLALAEYQRASEQAAGAARGAASLLAGALAALRADLASGALPAAAWAVEDWLARALRPLTG